MPFKVFIDDNFHYMDESERYACGDYDSYEEAVSACKAIVDKDLASAYKKGMSVGDLIASSSFFGEDPFIVPDQEGARCSARDYASKRCNEMCKDI